VSQAHDAVVLARAQERLRQESELFNQKKAQDRLVFVLRMAMGWTAVFLLIAICALCGYVILSHGDFAESTVAAATTALLVEALGLVGAIWRGTLGKGPVELEPTTDASALPVSEVD
jgi:uncharacterized membrane protein YqjE